MSFSRAQVKRFNDSKASGPAPGSYDVKDLKHSAGVLPFETGGVRFRKEEAAAKDESEGSSAFVAPSMPAPVSKKRLNFGAQNQNDSKSGKGTPRQSPTINKEKETYEKEIRRLLHQVNEQDKKLTTKSGRICGTIISFRFLKEIQKLENRISLLVKEKSSLSGQVISADKKVSELNKRNLLLESQNSIHTEKQQAREDLENELKKTKSKHETAKQELDKSKTMLVAMQSDLDGAWSTISALQKSNSELRQLNNETQQHTDDVGIQLTKLQRLVDDLRTEKKSAEQQLSAIKQRFEAVEKEFTGLLQTKADGIKKQFEEKQLVMVADLDRARNEAADSNTRCSELQNKVDILKDERDDISCKKAELEEKIKCIDEERSFLKESFSQQTVKLNECKCTLEETEKDRDDMKDKVSDLSSLVERLKLGSSEELDSLKKELKSVTDKYASKEEELNHVIQKLEEKDCELMARASSLESVIRQKAIEIEKLSDSRDVLLEELSSLKKKLEEEKTKHTEILEKSNVQSQELSELKENNIRLERESTQHAEESSEFKDQILMLEAKADALETQLMRSSADVTRALNEEDKANKRIEELEVQLAERKASYQAKLDEFTRRLLDTQKKLNHEQEKFEHLTAAKDSESVELRKARKLADEQSAKLLVNERLDKENAVNKERIAALNEEVAALKARKADDSIIEELNKWKDLYTELQERVEPFKSQLDAYNAERQSLLSEHSVAQAEMQALGKRYAELLGHQNHKQKIKHIVKIKQENNNLKQEVMKLRGQVEKMRKASLSSRPKRFDPSEAFQQRKENTPLPQNT